MTVDRAVRMSAAKAEIAKVIALAKQKYGMDLSNVPVSFNLRGRIAGWAHSHKGIRLNHDMLISPDEEAWTHLVYNTIPHEFAHIVCFRNPGLGRNHDPGWKAVCRALGGNSQRCHTIAAPRAKGLTYMYTTTTGKKYPLSERKHKYVEMGGPIRFRRNSGFGLIDKYCDYDVQRGHTIIRSVKAPPRPANVTYAPPPTRQVRYRRNTSISITSLLDQLIGRAPAPTPTPPAAAPRPTIMAPVGGMSKAEQVRMWIRDAKRNNRSPQDVMSQAISGLGMSKSQAQRYVTENWSRA